eukprot:4045774-Amphidinium_carterae.1
MSSCAQTHHPDTVVVGSDFVQCTGSNRSTNQDGMRGLSTNGLVINTESCNGMGTFGCIQPPIALAHEWQQQHAEVPAAQSPMSQMDSLT